MVWSYGYHDWAWAAMVRSWGVTAGQGLSWFDHGVVTAGLGLSWFGYGVITAWHELP